MAALTMDPRVVAQSFHHWSDTVAITSNDWLRERAERGARFVFEGAQGVLLDENHGWVPHQTWSTCTPQNAIELLGESGIMRDDVEVLGVLRAYHTRHGAGPLPTEMFSSNISDPNNPPNAWQGPFRVGHFDAELHRYALNASGGVDGLVLTHLDLDVDQICHRYRTPTPLRVGPPGDLSRQAAMTRALSTVEPEYSQVSDWVGTVESELGAEVVLESWGPTAEDKKPSGRLTS
jgi:adenylosuccinate synthase